MDYIYLTDKSIKETSQDPNYQKLFDQIEVEDRIWIVSKQQAEKVSEKLQRDNGYNLK